MFSLKLDTQSVRDLFPEGSESRLELQSAIIKNVVDSVIGKKLSAEISDRIQAEVTKQLGYMNIRDMVAAEFSEYVSSRFGVSTTAEIHPSGSKALQEKMKEIVKRDAQSLISDVLADGLAHAKQKLIDDEEDYINRVSGSSQIIVRNEIKKQVNSNFPELVNEIIKERLFPAAKA